MHHHFQGPRKEIFKRVQEIYIYIYISNHHRTIDNTYAMSKAVQLQVHGQWTRWLNYIQQDFSWATLMAMPPNLTSFCLASTFDTLPSPTNLKRWRITAEAKCTLCSKDMCTTAHFRSLQSITATREIYIQA